MNETIKTIILFSLLGLLLMTVGNVFGGQNMMWWMMFFSIAMNIGVYFYSDKIALYSAGATPLDEKKYPEVRSVVENLARKAKIPVPKLFFSGDMQPNAFATGRNPENSSVLVTYGLLETLDKEQLKGVLAHELSHIRNRDVLLATVASVIASLITGVISIARWSFIFGGDDRNRNGLETLAMIIIAPIAAVIIQMAISRQREFKADESGVKLAGNSEGLSSALLKIDSISKRVPALATNPAFSNLYIASPFRGQEALGIMQRLFSTHPPVKERVERLREIKI